MSARLNNILRKIAAKVPPIEEYGAAIEDLANHLNYDGLYTGAPTFEFDPTGKLLAINSKKLGNKAYASQLNSAISDPRYIELANKLAAKALAKLKAANAGATGSSDISAFNLGLTAKGGLNAKPIYK